MFSKKGYVKLGYIAGLERKWELNLRVVSCGLDPATKGKGSLLTI